MVLYLCPGLTAPRRRGYISLSWPWRGSVAPRPPHRTHLHTGHTVMAPKLVAFHPVHGYKIKPQQDLKTIKRNERERNRVQTVNAGFETLRRHVPTAAALKKMSKVGILNEAMDYIQQLCSMLQQRDGAEPVLLGYTSQPQYPAQYQHHPAQYSGHYPSPPPLTPAPAQYSPYPSQQSCSAGQHTPRDQGFYSPGPAWHSPAPPHFPPTAPAASIPASPASRVSSSTDCQSAPALAPQNSVKFEEESGDEDDILDAIAEWQQV